ncbi:MAG: hypothetical protein ACE5JU_20520, partial [Candidatus Binatia bacterium]
PILGPESTASLVPDLSKTTAFHFLDGGTRYNKRCVHAILWCLHVQRVFMREGQEPWQASAQG